jgi:hypothetical protein
VNADCLRVAYGTPNRNRASFLSGRSNRGPRIIGRNGTFSKGSRFISRYSATKCFGGGSAVVDRRKALAKWLLRHRAGRFGPLSSSANRAVESAQGVSSATARPTFRRRGLATSQRRALGKLDQAIGMRQVAHAGGGEPPPLGRRPPHRVNCPYRLCAGARSGSGCVSWPIGGCVRRRMTCGS